jgi:hypothetical protein
MRIVKKQTSSALLFLETITLQEKNGIVKSCEYESPCPWDEFPPTGFKADTPHQSIRRPGSNGGK